MCPSLDFNTNRRSRWIAQWQNLATTDVDKILAWDSETPGANCACVAKSDGVLFFETDEPGVIERYEQETGETFPETFAVESRPGRYHFYFSQTDESRKCGSITQKEIPFGSLRQNNAYVVAPGSIHPTTGLPYVTLNDSPIVPIPKRLIEWLQSQRLKAVSKASSALRTVRVPRGQHDVTLASIAGKLRDDGLNADEMEPVLIRHVEEFFDDYGSDYQEMARKVARSIGKKEAGFAGPTVLIEGKLPGEVPTKLIAAAAAEAKSDTWPPVTPLEDKLSPVAVFKPEFLPDSIRPWVVDVSERMSVPLDFAGVCALVTIAGVLGRRVFVCPKAKDKDWKESIALSGAVVADSGKAKTPTWKTFINTIVEKEADWQNEYKKRIAKYTEELESWEALDKANKELEKKSGVAQNTPPPPEEPASSRCLLLNDATPEKMHDVMKNNPCGLFYLRDELSSWVSEFDKEGREQQRGMFLAAMNGNDSYKVDRIGREGGSAIMCASVFGGFQPDMFREFLNNMKNVSDGMIPRFTFLVWPDESDLPLVDRTADDSAKQLYRRIVYESAEMLEKQVFIHFSSEAQPIFNDWLAKLNQKIKTEENPGKRSHLAKYKGALPKIAALLQIVDLISVGPLSGTHTIDVAHLNKAIDLLAYLETHMHRVYDCIQNPIQKAESVLSKHIKKGDLTSGFTLRVIQRKHWKDLSKQEYIDLALETLEENGWVRKFHVKSGPEGGRPTAQWEINPALIK